MSKTLGYLLEKTIEMSEKMNHLLEENKQLKLEIANLKGTQSAHINDVWTRSSYASVTAAPTNNSTRCETERPA